MTKRFMKVVGHVKAATEAVGRCSKRMWLRLTTEPGYADALAAMVVSTTALVCGNGYAVRFVQEMAHTFASLVRTQIQRHQGYSEGGGWIEPLWD